MRLQTQLGSPAKSPLQHVPECGRAVAGFAGRLPLAQPLAPPCRAPGHREPCWCEVPKKHGGQRKTQNRKLENVLFPKEKITSSPREAGGTNILGALKVFARGLENNESG